MTTREIKRRVSPEREFNIAGAESFKAEAKKLRAEEAWLRESTKEMQYDRMLRETDARARREYDFAVDVSWESSRDLIAELSDWVAESDDPILLRLNTPGGDEIAGLAIVDFVRSLPLTVDTLAIGEASSMGSILLQAGATRYITPHAVVLIHESRTFGEDAPIMEKLSDAADRIRLGKMLEQSCNALLAERSVFDGDVDALAAWYGSSDLWLAADDAVSLGFADAVWP